MIELNFTRFKRNFGNDGPFLSSLIHDSVKIFSSPSVQYWCLSDLMALQISKEKSRIPQALVLSCWLEIYLALFYLCRKPLWCKFSILWHHKQAKSSHILPGTCTALSNPAGHCNSFSYLNQDIWEQGTCSFWEICETLSPLCFHMTFKSKVNPYSQHSQHRW